MSDTNARIEQFRKMAHDDPDNELGHFSLGQEYLRAGMIDGAITSLRRVLELKPDFARAYELLATALLKQGMRPEAVEKLRQGVQAAHARGDIMPRDAMVRMLGDLGEVVPELKQAASALPVGEGQVLCSRCHQPGQKLAKPPFRNDLGKQIFEHVCERCWKEWMAMGIKVINELRLPLNDPQAQKVYDQYLVEFLNLKP